MHGMHRYAAGGAGLPLTLYRPDGIGFFADPGISAATFSKLKRNVPVEHPQGRLLLNGDFHCSRAAAYNSFLDSPVCSATSLAASFRRIPWRFRART